MAQRPPRTFRQRRADSDSSSDSEAGPGPGVPSGLGGRAPERATGAARARGRARVWATSRREGPSQCGDDPPDVDKFTSTSDSSGDPETPPRSPPETLEDDRAGPEDSLRSRQGLGLGSPAKAPGACAVPRRRPCRGTEAAPGDYLPLSEGPPHRFFGGMGNSDTDSEDGTASEASNSEGLDTRSSEGEAQELWEAQQMRKALGIAEAVPDPALCRIQHCPAEQRMLARPTSCPPVNLEIIKKRLNSKLASLEGVHRSHQREYEKYRQDIDSAKNAIEDLEKAPDPAPSHAFYKGLKAFLATLADCLSEKVVAIQELEAAMHSLLQKQATFFLERRQQELRTEASYLQQLAARGMDDVPQPGDSVLVMEAQKLLEESTARRLQRKQARESSGPFQHEEGMSSEGEDSVSPSQRASFQERRGDILQRCHEVFQDVSEEFSDIQKILLKFEQWREQFTDSYYEAYASLCLPKIFSPFIRIQMLDWNPLKPDCVPLQGMSWFRSLEGFARSEVAVPQNKDGPDLGILLATLNKTVLPHITGFVRAFWDPLSTSQTKSLVERCGEVLSLLEAAGSEVAPTTQHQDLLDAVVSRLKKAVEDDVFIPLYPKRFVEDQASPHSRFQERQFWSAVKLLGNILLWNGLLPEDILRELSLDKLLNRYLAVGLSNTYPRPGVAGKFCRVVESLPESWRTRSIPELCGFIHVLVRAAQQLHDEELRSEVLEMVLLLGKMNAGSEARAFMERNQLDLPGARGECSAGVSSGAAPDVLRTQT